MSTTLRPHLSLKHTSSNLCVRLCVFLWPCLPVAVLYTCFAVSACGMEWENYDFLLSTGFNCTIKSTTVVVSERLSYSQKARCTNREVEDKAGIIGVFFLLSISAISLIFTFASMTFSVGGTQCQRCQCSVWGFVCDQRVWISVCGCVCVP